MLVPTRLSPNRASDGFHVASVLERGPGEIVLLGSAEIETNNHVRFRLRCDVASPASRDNRECEVFTNPQLWTFPFYHAGNIFVCCLFSLGFHRGWSERDFSHQFLSSCSSSVNCLLSKHEGAMWVFFLTARCDAFANAVLFCLVSCMHTSTKMQPLRYKFLPPFSRLFTGPQLAAATGQRKVAMCRHRQENEKSEAK